MSLLTALNAATSGLRVTQAAIGVVSQNVANADTAGYTRRHLAPIQLLSGDRTSGVQAGEIGRIIDYVAQRQLRLETSGAAYAALSARFASEIDKLFGQPGGAGSLDGALNGFTEALQALASDPSSFTARSTLLDAATSLASRIGAVANGIQGLRTDAEHRLAASVTRANELLAGIAAISGKIGTSPAQTPSPALLDERDRLVNELSKLMDVQVGQRQDGSVTLMSSNGLVLFDGSSAVTLSFDARSSLDANAQYSTDPAKRGVGTITVTGVGGSSIDALASGMFRSGEIAAALALRDTILPQAQRQLDELAAGLASALSDRPDLVAPAAGSGFNFDMSYFAAGNVVTFDWQDTSTVPPGAPQRILLVPTNNGVPITQPPVEASDPSATVFKIDVQGGLPAALAAIGAPLATVLDGNGNPRFAVSSAGSILTLSNGASTNVLAGGITAAALSASPSQSQFPLFVDGGRANAPYTGSTLGSSQLAGFAQRIAVNPLVISDRAKLVVAGPGVLQGDATRPSFMLDEVTKAERSFSAATGIAGGAPFTASVAQFARRIVETQGANAELAQRLDEGQQVALAAAEGRFADYSGVNIDQEMALLVQLQTAYGANARIMTAVRDMLDMLMRI